MLRPPAPLLALAVLAGALPGQSFTDPDFDFTVTPPSGMRMLPEEERVVFFEITPGFDAEIARDAARNVPRAEAGGERISHNHIWVDPPELPYRRQIWIQLTDGPVPFQRPQDFEVMLAGSGLTIDDQEVLDSPPLGPGMIVEGHWSHDDGTRMAKMVACLFDAQRYAILQMQCLAGDYPIVEPQFRAMLEDIEWERIRTAPPGAGALAAAGRPGAPRERRIPRGVSEGDWGSLETLGSLILAAFVLGHLVLAR